MVLWSSYLLGTPQRDMIDANRQLITDTPDAVWAGETYKKFLRDASPPGSIGFNWNECQTTFMQGRAAMWVDGIGFAAPLEDRTRSRVAGKVGYALVPRGPGPSHHCALFGAGYGIPEASRKKGPAWLFIQWALGKPMQLRMLADGRGVPARLSPFRNEEAIGRSHFPREFFQTLEASSKIARAGLPEIVPVTQFRDVIGAALTNTISGADVAKRAEARNGRIPAGAGTERARELMPSGGTATLAAPAAATGQRPRRRNYARHYAWFVVPAAVVVVAVIVFPWAFTLYVSAFDWRIGGERRWVGLANYATLFNDARFGWAVLRTLFYTVLAVVFPDRLRPGRGACLPPPLPPARPRARRLHPADDGDAGRGGPGLDHDVPPAARRAELAADQRRPAALHVGLQRQTPSSRPWCWWRSGTGRRW